MIDIFTKLINASIDEKGVYPQQMVHCIDDAITISALALNGRQVVDHAWERIEEGVDELVFGVDMCTRPDQGTEFEDVVILGHYTNLPGVDLRDTRCWKIGVINYQNEPRIVRPIDWQNRFWTCELRKMFEQNA